MHKACHVDQVAAGPEALCDCQKCAHVKVGPAVWFSVFMQCSIERQCVSAAALNQEGCIVCLWLITSVWPVYYAFGVQREEGWTFFFPPPESFMMDGFHVRSRVTGRRRRLRSQSDRGWVSKQHSDQIHNYRVNLFVLAAWWNLNIKCWLLHSEAPVHTFEIVTLNPTSVPEPGWKYRVTPRHEKTDTTLCYIWANHVEKKWIYIVFTFSHCACATPNMIAGVQLVLHWSFILRCFRHLIKFDHIIIFGSYLCLCPLICRPPGACWENILKGRIEEINQSLKELAFNHFAWCNKKKEKKLLEI